MKKNHTKLLFVFLFLFIGAFFYANTVQALEYTFIESLPGIGPILTGGESGTFITNYLGRVYVIILGASAILALFMLVLGGVQYTYVALSPSAKNDAKERIKNALLGLLLVFGAYIILNTINPDLVSLQLVITKIDSTGGFIGGVGGDVNNAPVNPGDVIGIPGVSVPWTSEREQARRAELATGNVGINHPNACGNTGQTEGCTDVANLTDGAIGGVIVFNKECNCNVVVSGGSEWGHSTHTSGAYAFRSIDISKTKSGSNLSPYIYDKGKKLNENGTGCPVNSSWQAREINGAIYCDENSEHWHVIYP